MRNRNLSVRRNVRNNNQALVESIMTKIAPIVKNAITENLKSDKSFAGISNIRLTQDFNEVFEETFEHFYESKEEFQHIEDGLKFKYKYCISTEDYESPALYIVISPNSLSMKNRKNTAETACMKVNELEYFDVYSSSSYQIYIDEIETEFGDEQGFYDAMNIIANSISIIDGMFGFYLDKNDGWLIIQKAIKK